MWGKLRGDETGEKGKGQCEPVTRKCSLVIYTLVTPTRCPIFLATVHPRQDRLPREEVTSAQLEGVFPPESRGRGIREPQSWEALPSVQAGLGCGPPAPQGSFSTSALPSAEAPARLRQVPAAWIFTRSERCYVLGLFLEKVPIFLCVGSLVDRDCWAWT